MYRQYPLSEQMQREANVKVKETDPTCSQDFVLPCNNLTGAHFNWEDY